MAARSWPGAGPKLHTWDTPGPLLCGAADQGFRRHLTSPAFFKKDLFISFIRVHYSYLQTYNKRASDLITDRWL